MTYTAFSPDGPRIALAISEDLLNVGAARSRDVRALRGDPLRRHRQQGRGDVPAGGAQPLGPPRTRHPSPAALSGDAPRGHDVDGRGPRHRPASREHLDLLHRRRDPNDAPYRLRDFTSHHRLAAPVSDWESLKIGSGAPPVMTKHGWLFIYHGVTDLAPPSSDVHHLSYSAGVMILSKDHPQELLYRSTHPALVARAVHRAARDAVQRRLPDRHRPSRRHRRTRPTRRLLRDQRLPDRRRSPRHSRRPAPRRRSRPAGDPDT